ncbi:MAG: hypothetical protein V3U87_10190 [Methylococcaceae bacterium]
MNEGIIYIRDWVRTNGEMSEDGKSITYDCLQLETVISEALKKGQTFDLGDVSGSLSYDLERCGCCFEPQRYCVCSNER